MKHVIPEARIVASTIPDVREMDKFIKGEGGPVEFFDRRQHTDSPEDLIEFGGRLCYKSWEPGLNKNVTRVRADGYIENIVKSQHGSVLEHASVSILFENVSRVFTHELIRHRAGTAMSQESMRYVRVTEIPQWVPQWALDDPELLERIEEHNARTEDFLYWMEEHFDLDAEGQSFLHKKEKTSFMRRFLPEGTATKILFTANLREWRHIINMRTAPGAEEEMRLVFGSVAKMLEDIAPSVFDDFEVSPDGHWKSKYRA